MINLSFKNRLFSVIINLVHSIAPSTEVTVDRSH